MTTIDTTGLRTRAQSTAKAGGDIHIAPGSFLALLDALDRAETERDEWIARVKRDAAREALDGLAEHIDQIASHFVGFSVGSQKAQDVRTYRDTNYPTPEETP